jgi:hypothetical protein
MQRQSTIREIFDNISMQVI